VGFLLLPPSPARNRVFANVGLPLATIPHEVLLHHYSQNRAFALVFGVVGFLLLPPLRNRASVLDFWDGGLPAAITTTTNESEHPCSISCVVIFSLLLPLLPPKSSPPCSISGGGCLLAATTTTTLEIERLCSISGVVDDFSTTTRPPEMELSRSISGVGFPLAATLLPASMTTTTHEIERSRSISWVVKFLLLLPPNIPPKS